MLVDSQSRLVLTENAHKKYELERLSRSLVYCRSWPSPCILFVSQNLLFVAFAHCTFHWINHRKRGFSHRCRTRHWTDFLLNSTKAKTHPLLCDPNLYDLEGALCNGTMEWLYASKWIERRDMMRDKRERETYHGSCRRFRSEFVLLCIIVHHMWVSQWVVLRNGAIVRDCWVRAHSTSIR